MLGEFCLSKLEDNTSADLDSEAFEPKSIAASTTVDSPNNVVSTASATSSDGRDELLSDEASVSRLYGGIHFRPALDQGVIQGAKVANQLLAKVKIK